jgi:hypothetical protein
MYVRRTPQRYYFFIAIVYSRSRSKCKQRVMIRHSNIPGTLGEVGVSGRIRTIETWVVKGHGGGWQEEGGV